MACRLGFVVVACLGASLGPAHANEVKVLTAGAMKQAILATAGDFQKGSENTLSIDNDTVGALVKRIEGGAIFDVAVLTPTAIDQLAKVGKIGRGNAVARVGHRGDGQGGGCVARYRNSPSVQEGAP